MICVYCFKQNLSDRMALVGAENIQNDGVELRRINLGISSPPVWIDTLEETQYILSRLRVKIDNLIELHSRHVTRPTLDDKSQVRIIIIFKMIIIFTTNEICLATSDENQLTIVVSI